MGGKFERAKIYHAHKGFINWCKEKAPELLDCEGISRIESDFDSYENNLKLEVMQFDETIHVATTMRCLFGTKEGRIGLGPPTTLEGDRRFVLDGGKAPFILRRFGKKLINRSIEEYFELVSNSHVHGIMGRDIFEPWRSRYVYVL
jgi:hypothetical protein